MLGILRLWWMWDECNAWNFEIVRRRMDDLWYIMLKILFAWVFAQIVLTILSSCVLFNVVYQQSFWNCSFPGRSDKLTMERNGQYFEDQEHSLDELKRFFYNTSFFWANVINFNRSSFHDFLVSTEFLNHSRSHLLLFSINKILCYRLKESLHGDHPMSMLKLIEFPIFREK